LNVRRLIERYGELDLGQLRDRLRCQRCGGRRPQVILSWDNIGGGH
jgi:hypothetical protein